MKPDAPTFQAGDEDKARGDAGVLVYRSAEQLRAPVLAGFGWVQRSAGGDGLGMWDHPKRGLRLIHSVAREGDGEVWAHLSLSRRDRVLPTWEHVTAVKQLLYPDRVALQVLPPVAEWYSHAEVAHLFVCLSRRPTPDFRGSGGTL